MKTSYEKLSGMLAEVYNFDLQLYPGFDEKDALAIVKKNSGKVVKSKIAFRITTISVSVKNRSKANEIINGIYGFDFKGNDLPSRRRINKRPSNDEILAGKI
jgi:hypothetical protein